MTREEAINEINKVFEPAFANYIVEALTKGATVSDRKSTDMTIGESITRYKNNAEYERTHGNLQGCLEFRQLANWLEELRAYRNMYHADNVDNCLREEVLEDGNDD